MLSCAAAYAEEKHSVTVFYKMSVCPTLISNLKKCCQMPNVSRKQRQKFARIIFESDLNYLDQNSALTLSYIKLKLRVWNNRRSVSKADR